MKTCARCKLQKPLEDFHKAKRPKDGRRCYCKECTLVENRARSRSSEGRAKIAAYHASPERKAERAAYSALPDVKAKQAAWRAQPEQKAKRNDRTLRSSYGIDHETWARMYDSQDRRCAGCSDLLGFNTDTNVDHCHATGVVRGLLCRGCNHALGGVKDRPDALRRLATYLERYS